MIRFESLKFTTSYPALFPFFGEWPNFRTAASRQARIFRMLTRGACSVVAILFTSTQLTAQAGFGVSEKLNNAWSFTLTQPEAGIENLSGDSKDWQQVNLPHDWSVKGKLSEDLASCMGYLPGGIGWYRKTMDIPSDPVKGNKVFLYFEGVYNRSEVYLNGHLLGKRPNGYVSFLYDATPFIRFDESNTIAVRVDHRRQADSRWYTGSGIYRNVWLVRSQPVHIGQWGVFAHADSVDEESSILEVSTQITNEGLECELLTVIQELLTKDGLLIATTSNESEVKSGESIDLTSVLPVTNPHLWSLDDPYLYDLKTTVFREGKVIDQSTLRTGFRQMEFDPDKGFSLNGKNLKMKGVCLHHDAGVLGAAVLKEVWRQRLVGLKTIGCNAIRTSHNPQSPEFYDLCDELGFLVLDEAFDEWEFPKRKWLKGWNVGEPGFEGSYDFFEEWGERDVADMVRRDRNHPSVFAWSIGNEVDYPNDPYSHPILDGSAISQPMYGGYKPESPDANRLGDIAKKLVAAVKKYDTSRPVTAALAGVVMSNETEYPGALDIAGYNYTEDRYQLDHQKYPNRVIYGSENRHDYAAWKAVTTNDFIFGQFLWTGIDYLGESGPWPSRGFYSGLLDLGGDIKPRGYFRQALWSDTPVIYLGTMKAPKGDWQSMDAWPIWNYQAGEMVRVLSYTNAAKAELYLNGEPVGGIKSQNPETAIISWDIPYNSGELEVVGYDRKGQELCRNKIETTGDAVAMLTSCDTMKINRDAGLAIVELQVVDAEGRRVLRSDVQVKCDIQGPARLLGLEASNNSDMSDYTDSVHNLFMGKMKAYIQATGESGEVKVHFNTRELPAVDIELLVE